MVNIKLDKCGGLTEGLLTGERARALGMKVMVGNMIGTSLAMAPAFILGKQCDVVDLDGPIFLARDRNPGGIYEDGLVRCDEAVWVGICTGANRMTAAPEKTWFGHPRGLTILFLTSMRSICRP